MIASQTAVLKVPIQQCFIGQQAREQREDEPLDDLIATMKSRGQIQPALARKVGDKYEILDGSRRLRAGLKTGLEHFLVVLCEQALSAAEVAEVQLISNWMRTDLDPVDKALALKLTMEGQGLSASEVAARFGVGNGTVTKILAPLSLDAETQQHIRDGRISQSIAYELTLVEDLAARSRLAKLAAAGELTRDGVVAARKAAVKRARTDDEPRVGRATAALGDGRSITVAAPDLTLESFVEAIDELRKKLQRARTQGVELSTFVKMLRDQARAQ